MGGKRSSRAAYRKAFLTAFEKVAEAPFEERMRRLDAAARDLPGDNLVALKRAETLFNAGRRAEAKALLAEVLGGGGDEPALILLAAKTLVQIGAGKDVIRHLPSLSGDETARDLLAWLQLLKKIPLPETVVAMRRCLAALMRRQDLASTLKTDEWRFVAAVAHGASLPQLAAAAYEKSLAGQNPTAAQRAQLMHFHLDARQLQPVHSILAKMPATERDQPVMQPLLARYHSAVGNRFEAVAACQLVLATEPASPVAWSGLADHETAENLEELQPQLETVLKTDPQEADKLLFVLARIQARQRDYGAAYLSAARANGCLAGAQETAGTPYSPSAAERQLSFNTSLFPVGSAADRTVCNDGASRTPIFIVGMPRSGTTLLERILGSLAGVAIGGEQQGLPMAVSDHLFDLHRGGADKPANMRDRDWDRLAGIYRQQMRKADEPFLTDKLPQNYMMLGWAMHMFPRAPILYLQRDARDVALSLYLRDFKEGYEYAVAAPSIAHAIRLCRTYMAHWQTFAPGRVLEVSYESLVKDTEATTQEIAAFCGLEWDAACMAPHALQDGVFTMSNAQVRQPINQQGIGQWRRYEAEATALWRALAEEGLLQSATP